MSGIVEVKVVTGFNPDGASHETLYINGKEAIGTYPLYECPEDATLERDIVGASRFESLLETFLIEDNGKKVKFVYEEEEEEDDVKLEAAAPPTRERTSWSCCNRCFSRASKDSNLVKSLSSS